MEKLIQDYINTQIKNVCIKNIYPLVILKKISGSTCDDIYNVCEKYCKENKLQEIYEIRCPDCADVLGVYEYYGDIPEFSECLKCGEEDIGRINNSMVLYKIVR